MRSSLSREGSKSKEEARNFILFDPAEYLSPQKVDLFLKLQDIWRNPEEKQKIRSYMRDQRFSENECEVLFEIISNPGINEYQVCKKVGASTTAVKKVIKKHVGLKNLFSGLIRRGVEGKMRPLHPSELLITVLWEIYSFYETYGFPAVYGKKKSKSTRLISGLGYLEVDSPTRILLAKQRQPPSVDQWILPGGYFNPNKGDRNVRDTVRRRVRKIAGVDIAVESAIMVYSPLVYAMPTESHIFRCRIVKGTINEGKVADPYVCEIRLWEPEKALNSPKVRAREKNFIRRKFRDQMEFPEI